MGKTKRKRTIPLDKRSRSTSVQTVNRRAIGVIAVHLPAAIARYKPIYLLA
jgi:hypothetical protein